MCAHVLGFGDGGAAGNGAAAAALPSAAIACAPLASASGADPLTEESLLAAINEGATAPIDPDAKGPAELPVPAALMSEAAVAGILAARPPAWEEPAPDAPAAAAEGAGGEGGEDDARARA